jgi:hypothetical protein
LKDLIYRRGLDPAPETSTSLIAMSEAVGESPVMVETEAAKERVQ